MFPAYAGMNRHIEYDNTIDISVPRIRGDEPANDKEAQNETMCSPHTRG